MSKKSFHVISVAALALSICSIIISLSTHPQVSPSEKVSIAKTTTAVVSDTTKLSAPEVMVKDVCWNGEPCGEGAPQGWEFKDGADTYTLRLGNEDADHEIRTLIVRNAKGELATTGQLSPGLTYIESYSDLAGSPDNNSPSALAVNGNYAFRIEDYSVTPLGREDYRLPAQIKYIQPSEAFH